MDHLLTLLLGALLTWSFYFVQRRVERRRASEAIVRSTQLLALKQGMDEAHVTLEELQAFEKRLVGQAETAVRIADTMVSRAESITRDNEDATVTHDDMTREAFDTLAQTNARLLRRVAGMRAQLDGDTLAEFDAAHAAWLDYRERYARFIARSYAGGTVQPLIRAVTLDSLTAMWITELDTQLGVVGDFEDDDEDED